MGNMTTLMIFVVCFNLLLWLSQASIDNINPGQNTHLITSGSQGDIVGANKDNMATVNPTTDLPTEGGAVETESTGFTDIFGAIKSFFTGIGSGIKYLYNIAKAPYHFLTALGLPLEFVNLIGSAWYAISVLVVIVFIFRGND